MIFPQRVSSSAAQPSWVWIIYSLGAINLIYRRVIRSSIITFASTRVRDDVKLNKYRTSLLLASCYASRGLCCRKMPVRPSVRLFVCLSVRHTPVVCRNSSSKIFSPSDSHTILVFPHQAVWQYSHRDRRNGGVECSDGMKNRDFQPISRFISEMVQYRIIVTMEREEKTIPKLSNCTIFNDLQ